MANAFITFGLRWSDNSTMVSRDQEVTTVAHDMLLQDICNILPKLPFTLNSFLSPHAAMTLP